MSNGAGALLEILRRQPEASRSELAERTGLARSTVGQRLELLSALGYVEEAGPRPSTGGRPASTVRFKPDGGVILALDLGATHCRLAVTDLNREVLAEVSHELPIADGPEQVLGRVRTLLLALLRRARRAPAQVRAIGVGLPGPVEFASGRPVNPPIMPGWDGVDVPRLLSAFGAPVLVDNDVNIMALGEHREHWPQCGDFLFIKVATGIGCGIITGGRIHRGAQGAAGDIGHIRVPDADELCRCGNRGCLEAVASGGALARRLSAQGLAVDDARAVVEAAQRGEPLAVAAIRESGRTIGEAMAGMVNFFNPATLVIGGDLAHAGDELLAGIRGAVYERSLMLATRELRIVTSQLDEAAGVVGAATMATDGLFDPARVDALAARAVSAG
ncbi:ROK family transcriptional regulator [Conexibacter sp. JD483]|uniref:ROK family transcriptional regulator n=1 Tax=unclassified Conexibacter TaxID=2627773 RepID=UPI002722A32A|nr:MULTISPECIES: ROK family transcriptional regulator [unclassified Conexibacter]MDO8189272.1 ROK family transcriptional regulator [Conexibacter sp. CPCC 205706]MDO8201279.1 ROK family transcriptional regulator [Conexibacter sp. CPCC 205762]MDR9372166.1 ROK family transcriptional regulator [Conexibacter sp. JD483]